jgi:hypothetical protein
LTVASTVRLGVKPYLRSAPNDAFCARPQSGTAVVAPGAAVVRRTVEFRPTT